MINTTLISPVLSALVHSSLLGLVAWGVASPHAAHHHDVESYVVLFRAPAAIPTTEDKKPSKPTARPPSPKLSTCITKDVVPTQKTPHFELAHKPKVQPEAIQPTGESRDATYQAGTLSNPLPTYPLIARKNGHEGLVKLQVHISTEGKVTAVDLHTTSNHWELDQVAMDALKLWTFSPALQNGIPVDSQHIISFDFKLSGVAVI